MAIKFDGSTQYCTTPALPAAITGDITISAWIKQQSAAQERDIICYFQDGGGFAGWGFGTSTANLIYYSSGIGSFINSSASGFDFQTSTWVHGAVSAIGAAGTWWRNGVSVATFAATAPGSFTSAGALGARVSGNNKWLDSFCDVAVWKCGLTPGQMRQIYCGVSPLLIRPDSLVGYWPCRMVEAVLTELKTHSLQGTVVAGPLVQDDQPWQLSRRNPPFKPRWLHAAAAAGGGGAGVISGGGILSSRIFGSGIIRGAA